jgi:hypothetical protein
MNVSGSRVVLLEVPWETADLESRSIGWIIGEGK